MANIKSKKGFTLIELMIVVIIIGVLAGTVGPRLVGLVFKTKVDLARVEMKIIADALRRFEMENERFPTTAEGVDALMSKPADCPNWSGPYLDDEPNDPWETKYFYKYPASDSKKDFDIWSAGQDKRDGTDDDVKPK